MNSVVAAMLLAASLIGVTAPATASADCGDPGQPACAGPVPSVDEVVAIMAELTDPNRPAASKTDIVTPGFSPDEAETIDDHLHKIEGPALPLPFIVTDIEPAPNNFAGATVSTGGNRYQRTYPAPVVLVNRGGHWLITHDSAMHEMSAFWANGSRSSYIPVP